MAGTDATLDMSTTAAGPLTPRPVREVRICLVGFGSIARTHATALAALPATTSIPIRPVIAAIATSRPAAVAADAAALGVERVGSLADALADPTIDAFDITSRNVDHFEQAAAVLRAGRALYIEKPVGRTADEAERLADLAAAAPATTQVGLVMRYHTAILELRALVRDGAVGEVRLARLAIHRGAYLDPDRPISWKLRRSEAGGGAMLDLGVHLLDLVRFALGEPALTASHARTVISERPDGHGGRRSVDVDDWAWAVLRLQNGGDAIVDTSRVAFEAEGSPIQVFGTAGSITADLTAPGGASLRRFDGRERDWLARLGDDEAVRVARSLAPASRLTLGPYVDGHAAGLHHFLLRVFGRDPMPGLAPTIRDSAIAERLAADIVAGGNRTDP